MTRQVLCRYDCPQYGSPMLFVRVVLILVIMTPASSCLGDVILAVDIGVGDTPIAGSTPNDVQSGFEAFSFDHQFALGSEDRNVVGVVSQTRALGGYDVSLQAPNVNGAVASDYTAGVAGPVGDIAEDVYAAFGTDIILDVDGLAAGRYMMTTWHHWVSPTSSVNGMDVVVSNQSGGGAITVADNVQWSSGTSGPVASSTFGFTMVPGNDLRVRFVSRGSSTTVLNGFSIASVPEPGFGLGMFLAVPAVLSRTRRGLHRRMAG